MGTETAGRVTVAAKVENLGDLFMALSEGIFVFG
jgi:hypothetical protein